MQRTRSWWGWGWDDQALSDAECTAYGRLLGSHADQPVPIPQVTDLQLRPSRIEVPKPLGHLSFSDPLSRASHTFGKAYRDVVRALNAQLDYPPDLVARPTTEADVINILDWATSANVAVVPYGGGSSVVGAVECPGDGFDAVVSLDLSAMDRVLEVDELSQAACIQAGALGPILEDQLRPHGYTLRHFPQSFEFSTLGGWLATRAGGHYATLHTHIDDFVESMRVVTPSGLSESWRLPGSGAGPSPDRLMLGSEGTLGVITEAWMRIQRRPEFRKSVSVRFAHGTSAMAAVREIAQSGLHPANCRLLDPGEAALAGSATNGEWVLVLGMESAHHPVEAGVGALIEIAQGCGGVLAGSQATEGRPTSSGERGDGSTSAETRDGAADAWRSTFLRMPYVRDAMARMSAITETFETATTWDRVEDLYKSVNTEIGSAVEQITGAPGLINCRFTHVYPDGAAPYFTVIAAGRLGSELAMWDEIKAASMEVLVRHRATVTHHHAVGRDHRPGYDRQRPELFAAALRAVKRELDPAGIMNPGVLVDQIPPKT